MLVETFVRLIRLVEDETGRSPWLETPAKVKQVLANVKVEVHAAYQWKFGYLEIWPAPREKAGSTLPRMSRRRS
jgi:hypothetical protein